ncbi:MAG: hypothetical protein M1819_000731 [Sarea resinae]|nr:MAG: hypothetical protein M1819_000731 [Sarea resinae]
MAGTGLRFLRPYLNKELQSICRPAFSAHARFYSASKASGVLADSNTAVQSRSGDVQQRINELGEKGANLYPRITGDSRSMTCSGFRSKYEFIERGQSQEEVVTIRGRVYSSRIAGSKLVFFDLVQDGNRVQGVCDLKKLQSSGASEEDFKQFYRLLRRGDIFSITGNPHRTKRGELSISASELPRLLSPSLHVLPTSISNKETLIRNRHTELLIDQRAADTLRLKSYIIQHMREFFLRDGFLEVSTPILAGDAGGAIARPFITSATEFPQQKITLRIAPELWLKRLVLGGMDRVFEIGPSFRNEGLDATHNPEFTTCEFYKSYANLTSLIAMTESLLHCLSSHVSMLKCTRLTSLPLHDPEAFTPPYPTIDFIPALEAAMARPLPKDLTTASLLSLFAALEQDVPPNPTPPRLLDKLCQVYLEPQCGAKPTFILHPPACLSPLSKSFPHPAPPHAHHAVSARVELFVGGRELVNAYEEENDPFSQRRKFEEQITFKEEAVSADIQTRTRVAAGKAEDDGAGEEGTSVDEAYVDALEWGLPPTGGWGCGVDRLAMVFSGADSIRDVLSFGTLRNVVGLSSSGAAAAGNSAMAGQDKVVVTKEKKGKKEEEKKR